LLRREVSGEYALGVTMDTETHTWFGLSEEELRDALMEELTIAFRAEGDIATIHGLAHSIARVIEFDHLRIAEQLERAGIRLSESAHARPA